MNINKQYKDLLREILEEGFEYVDTKRDTKCKQISHKTLEIDLPQGFPAINLKKLYWKGVVAELLWFLRGDTNIKYLVDNGINIWNKDAYNWYSEHYNIYHSESKQNKFTLEKFVSRIKKANSINELKDFQNLGISLGDLGRVYGAQWRNWRDGYTFDMKEHRFMHGGKYPNNIRYKYLDQISNLIKNLKENPMSRRHIVTAWNPAELDNIALPSCHWSFEIMVEPLSELHKRNIFNSDPNKYGNTNSLMVRSDKNTWKYHTKVPQYQFTLKWHQRSVDSFLGKM